MAEGLYLRFRPTAAPFGAVGFTAWLKGEAERASAAAA